METYTYHDVLDFDAIQKLIDSLSATLHVGIGIRGLQGERLTRDSDCRFCQDVIKKSPIGRSRCEESDLALCAYKEHSPYICRCHSAGLTDAGINIMVEGVHVANILVGQVRLEEDDLSEEEYRSIARSLELDEEEYISNIREIPLISREHFDNILNTLSLIAEQFSVLGRKSLHQKSIISSLENQELVRQQERDVLEQLAKKDSMTGLYNHHKFDEVFAKYAASAEGRITLISADVNYLKLMNDIFGHDMGDRMLQNVARTMSDLARRDWLVARCGGDEFRVILPDTSLLTAKDYCYRVTYNCSEDSSLPIPLSVALGAAEWDRENESLQDCFARADEIMYQNKASIKKEQHIPDYIMERLYNRRIINKEIAELSSKITYDFALYLGLSEEQARGASLASYYQDIGMAKLPEYATLRGQSKTQEELLLTQSHVTHGYNIARQFEELYKVADIILCSHENWDGNSYPKHLTGYQIPVESRILRMTYNYAYWTIPTKRGTNLSKEDAKKRLIDFSGVMYDPDMVSKFVKFIDTKDY